MKILLAEDTPLCMEMLHKCVEKVFPQAEIECFEDGTFAWEAAQKTHYDLLITDYYMQKMNGPELAQKVSEKDPDTQILFQTSIGVMELLQSGLPIERCIMKPITVDKLKNKIDKLESLPPFRIRSVQEFEANIPEMPAEYKSLARVNTDISDEEWTGTFKNSQKRKLLDEIKTIAGYREISDVPIQLSKNAILDIFEKIPDKELYSKGEWNEALDYCLKKKENEIVKNCFRVGLCKDGLCGGKITVEPEVVIYRTGKVAIPDTYRMIKIRYKEILSLKVGWYLCVPTVSFEMKSGEQYKFIVFSKEKFVNLVKQNWFRR